MQEISRFSSQLPTQSVLDDTCAVVKWPGRDTDRAPLPSAYSNNTQVFVCPSLYVCMTFCLIKQMENFSVLMMESVWFVVVGIATGLWAGRRVSNLGRGKGSFS